MGQTLELPFECSDCDASLDRHSNFCPNCGMMDSIVQVPDVDQFVDDIKEENLVEPREDD